MNLLLMLLVSLHMMNGKELNKILDFVKGNIHMFWIGIAIGFIIGIITLTAISCVIASGEVEKNENKTDY